MKKKVEMSKEDLGLLCICALRYCHGRRTYMPTKIQGIVLSIKHLLLENDIKIIMDDENFQRNMNLWGDECDKESWSQFYRSMEGKQ